MHCLQALLVVAAVASSCAVTIQDSQDYQDIAKDVDEEMKTFLEDETGAMNDMVNVETTGVDDTEEDGSTGDVVVENGYAGVDDEVEDGSAGDVVVEDGSDEGDAMVEDVVDGEAPKPEKRQACTAEFCNPSYEPFPNLHAAMKGYHIMEGNPFNFHGADRGFKNSFIFLPVIKNAQHKYELHSGVSGSGTMSCSLKENFEQIATVQDYQRKLSSHSSEGLELSSNQEVEYEVSKGPVSVSGKVPPVVQASFSSSEAFAENEKFFIQTKGIISMKEAVCETYTLHVNLFDLPPFSPAIMNAVYELNQAIKGSEIQKNVIFDRFINEFGTHFVKSANMGARLSVTTRYTADEKSKLTQDQINECNSKSLEVAVGASAGYSTNKCNNVGNSNTDTVAGKFSRKYITSYGSSVKKSMTEWTQQDFVSPLPIKMELSPITNLFQDRYMGSGKLSYNGQAFTPNVKAILAFFGPRYWNYCEDHKDRLFPSGVVKTCNPESQKGCGWNDNCIRGVQSCIDDSRRSTGYRCCDDPCKNNPCKNGGTCKSNMGTCTKTCTCKVPWSGSTCTTKYTNKAHMTSEIRTLLSNHKSDNNDAMRSRLYSFLVGGYPGNYFSINVFNSKRQHDNDWKLQCGSSCGEVITLTETFGKNVVVAWGKTSGRDYSGADNKQAVFNAVHHAGCNTKTSTDKAWAVANKNGATMVLAVRFGNGLRYTSNGGGAFKNFQCGGHHSCNFWGKNCKPHESSLVVFYGRSGYTKQPAIACTDADWTSSFDSKGWSTCGGSTQYIRGFYRSAGDKLYNLEKAKCCTKPPTVSSTQHCTNANWWSSFDKSGWSTCPTNYFLRGLYRNSGNEIYNIEEAKCCRQSNVQRRNCYTQNIMSSFDRTGWSLCKADHYVTALYRGACNGLHCIEYMQCCQM